jgi:hypothetical protein
MLRRLLLLAALAALLAPAAFAQETTATLTGTVTDQTGAVLPGATVTARNTGTGWTKEVTSTDTGRFTIPFLPVGEYDLTVALAGFQPYQAKGLALHVNDRLTVNATLGVGGQETAIEVSAAADMIQTTPAVQTLMGATQVQELPLNNRNFVQLATLVPGVSSSLADEVGIGLTNVVSISMAGARRNAVNWFVDGASNVDVGSNVTLLSTPTLESIEEFKIITSSYAAEWPRSGGGIVNVVTKGGTNTFRATAYEFYRNDALNANSYFRKQTGCTADPANPTAPFTCSDVPAQADIRNNPPQLDYHNFGFTLGGPVIKDKLFFFGSIEWRNIDRAPTSLVATVPDPAWLSDPSNANYVPPAQRDPNAVALLSAYPAPNTGTNQYQSTAPNAQDTRQEVLRLDWNVNSKWRLMARYTHDLSKTTEPGGLFFGTALPDIATTITRVPGQVFVTQLTTTISHRMLNEFSFQFSANAIKSEYGENARNKRDEFGLTIPEIFPENRNNLVPSVAVTGLSSIGAPQLFDNYYRNFTFADNLSYVTGNHTLKGGFLIAIEQKNELSTSGTQGSFSFAAGGGRTAFQSFLTGNSGGLCGANCTYTEPEKEVDSQFRWNRYEFFLQDTWKLRPGLTLDLGLRYVVYPGVVDNNDILTNFVPSRYSAAAAPAWSSSAASTLVVGSGDFTNGIITAGGTSPYGRRIHATEWDKFQPRLGFSWDPRNDGKTLVRGGFGIYYDQPLIGIFLQNAFVNPPYVTNPSVLNPLLSNPGAGQTRTTVAPVALIASSDDFTLPRTTQWNVGVQRQLFRRAVVDVGYIGSKGDNLIQPVDINAVLPADVMAQNGVVNLARPYQGYAGITMRQTTGYTRYHAGTLGFRYDAGRAGTLSIAYTLSQAKTTATNDRDAVDLPQDRTNLDAEYALARNDRTHIFTANWIYELPFFKDSSNPFIKATVQGWQLSGIATFWSGQPVSRIVNGNTNGSRRGIRVDQIGDPFANQPPDGPGYIFYFNPGAYAPPADGQFGNTGRAPFRLPGVNQWDLTLSKNWYFPKNVRLQFRADFINALNHTQFDGNTIQNTCPSTTTPTCVVAGNPFGRITGTRAPREIQLGLRLMWN